MGVPNSRGGGVSRRVPSHQGVHQDESDSRSVKGGLPPHLCTVHRGGADAGDKTVDVMVGSRRGKQTVGIDEEEVYLT